MTMVDAEVFEAASQPPPSAANVLYPILSSWEELRSSGIRPLHLSELAGSDEDRLEFLRGAEYLRLVGPRAIRGASLQPQQLIVHDMLAAGHGSNGIMFPRRSSKTTSLLGEALGRAENREDYRVAVLTATTGKAGRSRFMRDVVPHLERLYPDEATAPFKLRRGAGTESVTFKESAGFVAWLSSIEDARGEAFDFVIADESQDPEPERAVDILAAVLPTIDTRPGAQIVFAGTVGKYRTGNLLWDQLETGRAGRGGIAEYAAPDSTSEDELASWEPDDEHPAGHVRELIELAHPGVGRLTTLDAMRDRYDKLKREAFTAEYLGIWPASDGSRGILNMEKWRGGAQTGELPTDPPEHFALAVAVHPDQLSASIVAAWRDGPKAQLLMLDHRPRTDWLPDAAVRLSRLYKTPIIHDVQGAVTVEVEQMQRKTPRPRLLPQSFPNVKTAAALLVKEVESGRVQHWDQEELNEAARIARKRSVGPTSWALGRVNPGDDITPLEAAAMALRQYDESKPRMRAPVM